MTDTLPIIQGEVDRFRSLFENVLVGIYRAAPDGRLLLANPALVEMLGYGSFAEMEMRKIGYPHFVGDRAWTDFKARLNTEGDVKHRETVWRRSDGRPMHVRENAIAVADEEGTVVYYEGTVEDITEQVMAQEALRVRDRAMDAASNGIYLCDATEDALPIVYCNAALARIVGHDREDILGQPCHFWEGEKDAQKMIDRIRKAIDGGREYKSTVKHRRTDGMYVWNELAVAPVRDAGGRLTHVVGIQTDITKRREAEHKLRQSQQALEDQTDALRDANETLRENQAQLVHSEKMASLGQLAAGVAHEINNPMGFLRSNLSTLTEYVETFKALIDACESITDAVDTDDAKKLRAALKQLNVLREEEDLRFLLEDVDLLLAESLNGAERVREIVQNLKSFARLDEAEVQEADLNDGLRATIRMIWNELKYKCDVVENLTPLPPIRCIPSQLNQVFMNLLINAAQAIEEHGEITVDTFATDTDVVVRITDTGCGIPEEHLPELFNPFFTTKPVGEGTGLGLSISYGIVKKHNGRIEVESKLKEGTAFSIVLPINAEPHA